MANPLPIGVFDSGVGGLTVLKEIERELPNEQIVYFGDTARCPYGDRDPAQVVEFSQQVLDFLVDQHIKMLVVACNTATAAALPLLQGKYDIPVIGVIQPGARAALRGSNLGRIGVIGTAVTVQSGAYERAIRASAPDADVHSLACPEFVPLVEAGLSSGSEVGSIVQRRLQPLVGEVDSLILGCTHYPLLQEEIQRVMGSGVRLISSAAETAFEVHRTLASRGALSEGAGQPHRYYTTGTGDRMRFALANWLGLDPDEADIQTVEIDMLTQLRAHIGDAR